MRCDVCLCLGRDWSRVQKNLRVLTETEDASKKRHAAGQTTARQFADHQLSLRKAILYNIHGKYAIRRKLIAADEKVKMDDIPIDRCVPDDDARLANLARMLNDRRNPELNDFEITETDIHLAELLRMDEEGMRHYINGQLGEKDVCEYVGDDANDSMDGRGTRTRNDYRYLVCDPNLEEEYIDSDESRDHLPPPHEYSPHGMGTVEDSTLNALKDGLEAYRTSCDDGRKRRALCLLTAVERLITLRRFHYEHVT